MDFNLVELLNGAALTAVAVVVFATQALKYVPVEWTSRYAVWVNIILSFIGSVTIIGFPIFTDFWHFILQWFTIAVTAALAYNHLVSKAVAQPVQ